MAERAYWLLKSEPSSFSFEDLWRAPRRITSWGGVRNYTARNTLRDEMKRGDGVLFYHSSTAPPAVVGLAEVVREGYPDPTQFDPEDDHFDPKARAAAPRWYAVDVRALAELVTAVPLARIKGRQELSRMALVQPGSRLSVQPVRPAEWRAILALAGSADPFKAG